MGQDKTDTILLGKIGSSYGVKGWLKIISYTEFADSILDYKTWLLKKDQQYIPYQLEKGRLHGKGLIAKLQGIETPEQAKLLANLPIYVPRSALPDLPDEEYYWSDLKGLKVINQHGEVLGTVITMMETGANDVLVVKGIKEHAIPYLPKKTIIKVDLAKKEIHVDWEVI